MEAKGLVDDAVEMVKMLELQVLDFVKVDRGIDGSELFAELGDVRRVAYEFIDDMRQCAGGGITVRWQVHLVSTLDATQRETDGRLELRIKPTFRQQ